MSKEVRVKVTDFQDFHHNIMKYMEKDLKYAREYSGNFTSSILSLNSMLYKNDPILLTSDGDPYFDTHHLINGTVQHANPYLIGLIQTQFWNSFLGKKLKKKFKERNIKFIIREFEFKERTKKWDKKNVAKSMEGMSDMDRLFISNQNMFLPPFEFQVGETSIVLGMDNSEEDIMNLFQYMINNYSEISFEKESYNDSYNFWNELFLCFKECCNNEQVTFLHDFELIQLQEKEEYKIIGRDECKYGNCVLVPKRFYDNKFKPLYYNIEQIIFLKLVFHKEFFNETFLLLPKVYNYFNTGVCVHFKNFYPYSTGSSSKMFMGTEYNGSKYLIIKFKLEDQDDLINHLLIQSLLRDEDKNIIPQLVSFTFYRNKNAGLEDRREKEEEESQSNDNILYIQVLMEDLEAQDYIPYAQYITEIVDEEFNNISKQYSKILNKCKHHLFKLIKTEEIKQTYNLFENWKSYIEKRIKIQEEIIKERIEGLRYDSEITKGRDLENVNDEIEYNEFYLKNMKLMEKIAAFFYFPCYSVLKYNFDNLFELFGKNKQGEDILEIFFKMLFKFHVNFIFHYDLHQNNIFINRKTMQMKLIDFGISQVNDTNPEYMDPEDNIKRKFFSHQENVLLLNTRNDWKNSSDDDKIKFISLCLRVDNKLTRWTLLPYPFVYTAIFFEERTANPNYYNLDKYYEFCEKNQEMENVLKHKILDEFIVKYFTEKYFETVLKYYKDELPIKKENLEFATFEENFEKYSGSILENLEKNKHNPDGMLNLYQTRYSI